MNKLTERNGQYYLDGNLASYDEVIVFLQEENERLNNQLKETEDWEADAYAWRDYCNSGELSNNEVLQQETKRLKHIIELLASEIDISNEVFDVLSAEHDYEWISSHAKK